MKYNLSLRASLLALLSLLLLTACEDPIDASTQWRINNESSFNEYASNEEYTKASIEGSSAYVYMKWLAHGEGKEYPIETSRIKCHYEMRLLVGDKVVDGNYGSERSAEFAINRGPKNQLVEGARIGLQQMVVGDEAEIIIPWYLGYGERRSGEINPYSALKFRVKLEEIIPESQRSAVAED
ncbi:FKBP-type peptidyl-prolyl cis-trans isomerase [Porphyromonas asaccharolytica]|mgnify:FL=1|uniref:Peptidyl-prolyl cis-trans isomerase n=1 Tax=Porphyromonas asaccharolytica (strain ATCC 25260 / DSM 20707 / BCRC 10618 / CCUG 7834 / JCM 6326 / LMG 13178 / VPI 4198 / B440) TaxID=879243 RepID=F4KLY8_PORAD|nr:FKBP-type peptidyl-prolyl cis-trans isomerase [Porphyromonas asaccharolytica]AEE12176.1 peptidylprolyl isomerase FKBP-type [Porphyromonas asaccharolytica DSM 20707]EFR35321.1 peptidyl-prolyl cis-trans isomerase, FKBP-type [Porphyromonas asaccharolytica PR426713P-I]